MLVVSSFLNPVSSQTLIVNSSAENPDVPSPEIALLETLFERAELSMEITAAPFRIKEDSIERGDSFAAYGFFRYPAREVFAYYVDVPLYYSLFVFYLNKEKLFAVNSLADLAQKKVGVIRGYRITDDLSNAASEGAFELQEFNSYQNMMLMLANDRIDAFIGNQIYIDPTIEDLGYGTELTGVQSPLIEPKGVHLIISKKANNSQQYAAKLNSVMEEMARDGTIDRIFSQYPAHDKLRNFVLGKE